jgi:RNA polymerase sigma factor (sigma-70 family)
MWGEIERSPVLAAPSFNDYVGLTATSTNLISGEEDQDAQAANDRCKKYLPLARKIASNYRDRGVHYEDLRCAAELGLTLASRKFEPDRGAFGPYAKLWIKGEITRLFKPTADAMAFGRSESLSVPAIGDDQAVDLQVDETTPAVAPDLSELTEREQTVLVGRSRGETLSELGSELGISQERVRQVEAKATQKAQRKKGNVALACIRDLVRRRGYRKGRREVLPFKPRTYACHAYTQAETEALAESCPELLLITAGEDEKTQRWWMEQRLRSTEATDWGRKTEGAEQRFATAGSISWKTLARGCGLSTVESAKRKAPEEHLHKFLTHHEIERLRFDMRAKLCGGSRVERPRKGPWCNKHARVSPRYEAGVVVEHERYRNDALRLLNCVPDAYEPKPTKQADLHHAHCDRLAATRGNEPFRRWKGPFGGAIIIYWGRP